jgi:hypothetical protein
MKHFLVDYKMFPSLPQQYDPKMKALWGGFDGAMCMSLREGGRQKNIDDMKNLLHIDNMEVFYAERDVRGGVFGCFDSHRRIAIIAKERGWKNVVVFEDDFLPTKYLTVESLTECLNFVKKQENWDVLYLGGMPCGMNRPSRSVKGWKGIKECPSSFFQTHCYVMSENMINFMASIDLTVRIEYDKLTSIVRSYYHKDLLMTQLLANSSVGTTPGGLEYNYKTAVTAHQIFYKWDQTIGQSYIVFMSFLILFLFLYSVPMHDTIRIIVFSILLLTFLFMSIFCKY